GGDKPPIILDVNWHDYGGLSTDKSAGPGEDVVIEAIIWDIDNDINVSSIKANVTNLTNITEHYISFTRVAMNKFVSEKITLSPDLLTEQSKKVLFYWVYAKDMADHNAEPFNATFIIGTNDIDVGILEIYADPVRPTHGDRVKFDIHLFNSGYKTAVINITANNSKTTIPLTNPFFNGSHTIFGRSPLRVPLYWEKCGPGGTWPITFNATVLNGYDVDTTNNVLTINFTIMPTILFVDDTGLDGLGKYMAHTLDAGGFKYTLRTVSGGNGPQYDTGSTQLKEFDIVIWYTGKRDSTTLTVADMDNVTRYLSAGNHSLWLIGQGIVDDLVEGNVGGKGRTFMSDQIHMATDTGDYETNCLITHDTFPKYITGHDEHPVGAGLNLSTNSINPTLNVDYIKPGTAAPSSQEVKPVLFNASKNAPNNLTIAFQDFEKNVRVVFSSFDLTLISTPGQQTMFTYRVIKWLGNISRNLGHDVAIAEQNYDKVVIKYMDYVNISAVVRNNGDEDEHNVKIDFYDNGMLIPDTDKPEDIFGKSYIIPVLPGNGGVVTVWKYWLADKVGYHTIVAKVDPDNMIDEIDEDNNVVSSEISPNQLYVMYSILVVDDDGSSNNGDESSTKPNATANVTAALDNLGYLYTLKTAINDTDTADASELMRYNAVIWVCGNSSVSPLLTQNDTSNISDYLNNYAGRFWLMGQNVIDDLSKYDYGRTFMNQTLKIVNATAQQPTPNPLIGVKDDAVGHGLRYRTVYNASYGYNQADYIVPNATAGAEGFLGQGVDIEHVWIEDSRPIGSVINTSRDGWNWTQEEKYSGKASFWMDSGYRLFGIDSSVEKLFIPVNNYISFWVKMDPLDMPSGFAVGFINDTGVQSWAYWGSSWGNLSAGAKRMGDMPPGGRWFRLTIPANVLGLEGKHVKGVLWAKNGGGVVYIDRLSEMNTNASAYVGVRYEDPLVGYRCVVTTFEYSLISSDVHGLLGRYYELNEQMWRPGGTQKPNGERCGDFDSYAPPPPKFSQIDPEINFEWGVGGVKAPDNSWSAVTNYAVRWTGRILFDYSENYTFICIPDDGMNLWIDQNGDGDADDDVDEVDMLINGRYGSESWSLYPSHTTISNQSKNTYFTQGWHAIRIEYFNGPGFGKMILKWRSDSVEEQVIPARNLDPLIGYGSGEDEQAELAFRILNWFDQPETKPELKVDTVDMYHTAILDFNTMKPSIGNTFVLQAKIWNFGGANATVPVRFYDGESLIDTVLVTVMADNYSVAEVIWKPQYAGVRTISVRVDPGNVVSEKFENTNYAENRIKVYYFWDD
ncbi:MAG: CARDB domain-containing protein, partial [Thermoplasmata archaeon]